MKLLKKCLSLLGILLMVSFAKNVTAQNVSWSDVPDLAPYSVIFHPINSTCMDNGGVEFAIVNKSSGVPIDEATFESLHLGDFSISYRGTQIDTGMYHTPISHYSFPWNSVYLPVGTTDVILEFTHAKYDANGHLIGYDVVDTATTITVEPLYQRMDLSVLGSISYDGIELGNIPTLDCDTTGRMVARVEGGHPPFHFIMKNNTTSEVLYDSIFEHCSVEDEDTNHYFIFDKVPSGDWAFYVTDGCMSSATHVVQTLGEVTVPRLDYIEVYASSGNIHDSNVVKINAVLDSKYSHYMRMFAPYMEFRFLVDGIQSNEEPWKPFPYVDTAAVLVYDTVFRNHVNYCDFIGKNITFQLRLKEENGICDPYLDSKTFKYNKPNANFFETVNEIPTDSIKTAGGCATITTYGHKDNFSVRYKENRPNYYTQNSDHKDYRYHFTYPIVWEYYDAQAGLLKRDTILNDISKKSTISAEEMIELLAAKGITRSVPFSRTITRRLVDATGCELYSSTKAYDYELVIQSSQAPSWGVDTKDPVCRSEKRSIRLFERNGPTDVDYDGLTIRLIESPLDNLYNFKAIYHHTIQQTGWQITEDRVDNPATEEGGQGGRSLTFWDYGLPSGTYKFVISNQPCKGNDTISVYMKERVSAAMTEEPAFELHEDCAEVYLKCVAGRISKVKAYRPNNGTNGPEQYQTTDLPTYFRIISGPPGGYDVYDLTLHQVGDSIRLSVKTDPEHPYVFEFYTTVKESDICGSFHVYDTIFYGGRTVTSDFRMGLLCDANSHTGNIYIHAKEGTPPYTYRLYRKANLVDLMDVRVLDEEDIAKFLNVDGMDVDSVMSCQVEDRCGSSFMFNFQPQSLADLQKVWFDGGKTEISTCEGSYVTIHTLQAGVVFEYRWYLNDADTPFTVLTEPSIFLPRGADTGVYRVRIYQTGCAEYLEDSVTIYPLVAPYLQIDPIGTVCPGQEVPITFRPYSPVGGTISFRVAFENRNGIEYREYEAQSGQVVNDVYVTTSDTKIYPDNIVDARCDYPNADPADTVFVYISNNIINPCQILTQNTKVCYENPATVSATTSDAVIITPGDPLTLTWCSDYSLTDTLAQQVLTHTGQWSSYTIDTLKRITYLYASVSKSDMCPSSNLFANAAINITNGAVTELQCTDSYFFCDDGGLDGDYSPISDNGHQLHMFISKHPGTPVTLHFETLELSPTSHIMVFSGTQPLFDSLLVELSEESPIPDVIMSGCDTMLFYFIPGELTAPGWSAFVRPSPGIAVADVWEEDYTLMADTVCQSHFLTYTDPRNFAQGDPVLMAKLNNAVKQSRMWLFERTETNIHGCDSIVALSLLVTPSPYDETDQVMLSLDTPLVWQGQNCSTTGQYYKFWELADGCDSTSILNLIVLEVDTSNNEICKGQTAKMELWINTPDLGFYWPRPSIGDVLCTDGTIMRPDSFVANPQGKIPMGVVFYIEPNDPTHMSGRAVALYDAYNGPVDWARQGIEQNIHSAHSFTNTSNHMEAMGDFDGYRNTMVMRSSAIEASGGSFKENSPAAYYCWMYDHLTHKDGEEHKSWYLPALGELNMVFVYRAILNKTLLKLHDMGYADPFQDNNTDRRYDSKYWSSTESGDYQAYCISGMGQLNRNNGKTIAGGGKNPRYVRAVISFPIVPNQ